MSIKRLLDWKATHPQEVKLARRQQRKKGTTGGDRKAQRARYKIKHPTAYSDWAKTARGRILKSLASAKRRCENPKDKNYKSYGAKGIKYLITNKEEAVALLLSGYQTLLDAGKIPSINRIDSNKHYSLDNIEAQDKALNEMEGWFERKTETP